MSELLSRLSDLLALFGLETEDLIYALVLFGSAAFRLLGTTVQTGNHGLKYTFGRAHSVVGPGFHALIPWLQIVVQAPTRSRTLDLPTQYVRTRDGLVYEVNANVTFRVVDLEKALVEVADLDTGLLDVLALCVQAVMEQSDRGSLTDLHAFDQRLHERLQARVEVWGVQIEQVGFTTATPVGASMELVQLGAVMRERAASLRGLESQGLPRSRALALIGTRSGYQNRRRRSRVAEATRRVERRRTPKSTRPTGFEFRPSALLTPGFIALGFLIMAGLLRTCG